MIRSLAPRARVLPVALAIAAVLISGFCPTTSARSTRLEPRSKAEAPAAAVQQKADQQKYETGSTLDKDGKGEDTSSEVDTIPLGRMDTGEPLLKPGVVTPVSVLAPGTTLATEVEPNGTFGTATPIAGASARIRGNVYPNADIDFYSFSGTAGDRIFAAVMTSSSSNNSTDSVLDLIAPDGTTVIETDDNDGSFGASSSTIAGRTLAATGTHFLLVRHFSATTQLRPYDLHFRRQTGAPVAEVEANDTTGTAQPLPASGWITGSTSSAADQDFYSVALNAGDTVFLSLDLDPERDTVKWNGRVGFALFGTGSSQILVTGDGGTATPDSEAMFFTVQTAGTYFVHVSVQTGALFGTYQLSTAVFPRVSPGTCTTYTSTNVPITIPTGPGIVTSTLTVPGNPRIDKLRVNINLTHNFMADLDVQLTSPTGTTIGLFSDIGSASVGVQTGMNITFDDDAAIHSQFALSETMSYMPEPQYRLEWLQGLTTSGGTWTLTMRDDATGDGGTLNAWSLEICEDPQPLCGMTVPTTVFSADFEATDGGFTHSGTADEWERGTPTFAPITSANSGTMCWKTDLDNTYNASSSQDLFSPNIVLPATGPIRFSWAQKYQMEPATFDHAWVEVREVGGSGMISRVFEHLGADMVDNVGNPTVAVQEAAGWQLCERDISAFAGLTVQLVFHVDTDTTVQRAGLAIDDVLVQSCPVAPMGADVAITSVTDSPDPVNVGSNLTHTINAINNGPAAATGVSVSFTLPSGTTYVSSTTPMGWSTMSPPVGTGGTVTFSTASIPNGGTASFTVVSAVPCNVPNATALFGQADIIAIEMDPNPGNSLSEMTTVNNAAPTITCPANITQNNDANQCGAVVSFAATATDDAGCVATVACVPASGSFFPVGSTTVNCTATDAAGQMANCSFSVTIVDAQVPTITCPANLSVPATTTMGTTLGAIVNYGAPTASDNCPGVGAAACVPASGSFFPVGVNTVICTVADASSNTAACSFTITVGTAFGVCIVNDGPVSERDTLKIVTDPTSALYGFWQYTDVSTGTIYQGFAEFLVYVPGRSLIAYDHDSPNVRMDVRVDYGRNTATATVKNLITGVQFVLRDRNILDDPACQ
ncbi:MAG: HYR domain-containing protein [Blastocatellia bacterium]|nr:HYR domain-containing protein [Blastocatellia bacterium]